MNKGSAEGKIRILALSDRVDEPTYSPAVRERFGRVDLVLACGDLPFPYLEYVLTVLNVPLLYVPGNHDRPTHTADGRTVRCPEGAINADGRIVTVHLEGEQEITVAGLGGSMRYSNGDNQYTEWEMRRRAARLRLRASWSRWIRRRRVDILITHAPPRGVHAGTDRCHEGFGAFLRFLRKVKPRLHLHGHIHPSYGIDTQPVLYHQTTVQNIFGAEILEWEI